MKFYSQVHRRCLSLIDPFVLCLFIFLLFVFYITNKLMFLKKKDSHYTDQKPLDSSNTGLLKNELPLCELNLLDKKSYNFEQWATRSLNNNKLLSKTPFSNSCTLIQYSIERAVECFDILNEQYLINRKHYSRVNKNDILRELHFMFIGDSRIRQQFFYFLKLVPDYDRITDPIEIQKNVVSFHHGDVEVQSKILQLRVSFKWRPVINYTLIETLRNWTLYSHNEPPNLIFLSMEVHHMLKKNGADFQLYQRNIAELGPILDQLSKVNKVIWLNQYPTIEIYGESHAHNTYIHSEKVQQYNEVVHRIFKNYGTIQIWDSSNPLAQEYVRGCVIFNQREIPIDVFVKDVSNSFINCKSYTNCNDYIHTGYVALSRATQLLYNDVCNFNIKNENKE